MPDQSYRQFCPVAMAAELLCTRWTMIILRELTCGPARFNELRRGAPRISPALLSQRLKELEEAGIVERRAVPGEPGVSDYRLSASGEELKPLVEGFGKWGQRWVSSTLSLDQLDAQLLMWDMRRNIRTDPMPDGRRVIQFHYPDAPRHQRNFWLVVDPGQPVDLCSVDPGHDVDLYVTAPLRLMTALWMGIETVRQARDDDRLLLTGDPRLAGSMVQWLGRSPFATEERQVA